MDDVVYHDELGSGVIRAGLIVAVASLAFAAFEAIRGFPNEAVGLLLGIFGTIVGLAMWSASRYSRVRVTARHLQVGRARLHRSDIDPAFGVQGVEALTEREKSLIESPFPIAKSASVRIPGGAFGRISGTSVVVLRAAGGESKLAVPSRKPDELREVLQRWLLETS